MGSLRGAEAFLASQGIAQEVEEAVCELALCQPPDAVRRDARGDPGARDAAAAGFLADVLAEKLDDRAALRRAERLATQCDVRSPVLYDRLAEAFLVLAEEASAEAQAKLRMEPGGASPSSPPRAPGVLAQDLVRMQRKLCADLPSGAREKVLDMVKPLPMGHLLSYNDFMCHMGACLAMRELADALSEAFEMSESGYGGLCVDTAMSILEKVDWDQGLGAEAASMAPAVSTRAARLEQTRKRILVAAQTLPGLQAGASRGEVVAIVSRNDFVRIAIEEMSAVNQLAPCERATRQI